MACVRYRIDLPDNLVAQVDHARLFNEKPNGDGQTAELYPTIVEGLKKG